MDLTGGPSPKRPRVSLEDVNVKRVQKIVEDHNTELWASILKLKADEDLCDVTIKCRDFEVKAHKMILVASTDYFRAMFRNDTKESQSQIVDFSAMDPDVVKQIVDFIYTGSVWITMDIARGLLDSAEMMQLPKLSELCVEFLAENVDMKSCAEVMSLLRLYKKKKLNLVLQNFLEKHFEEFRKTADFLSLDYTCLVDCLGFLKEGCSPLEEQKWFGILSWTKAGPRRKKKFSALFKMVDLHCLSNDFLGKNVCYEDLVRDSVKCMQQVQDVILNIRNPVKNLDGTNEMSGIVSVNSQTGIVYQYHLASERCSRLAKFPGRPSAWHNCSITMHQGTIYIWDGQTLWSFDGNEWKKLHSENYISGYNVCVCFQRLVIVVSSNNTVIFNTDSLTASHVSTRTVPHPYQGFFIATSPTDLYVMGGAGSYPAFGNTLKISRQVQKLRLLAAVGISYSLYPSLTKLRAWGKSIWYENTLYALGGGAEDVEFLNHITEQWQLIANLKISCDRMKTHITNNKLYIFSNFLDIGVKYVDLDTLHVSDKDRQPTLSNVWDMNLCCGC